MADYAIIGRKGSGKSLFSVGLIRDALRAKKRVATNLDIDLHALMGPRSTASIARIPDKPTVDDLEALGRGQAGVCEEENGIIVLDETSTFFNSRAWGDKARQPLLDWLVHSRKLGWDIFYICQGLEQIDKQLRATMIEYVVHVKRTDKWPIPFVTPLAGLVGLNIRFPKMHVGIIKHGTDRDSLTVERRWYKGHELYPAYNTQQLFLDRSHADAVALHSVLPPSLTHGRYLPDPPPLWWRVVCNLFGWDWRQVSQAKPAPKPKHPLVVLCSKLPPDQALRHIRRLEALGAFDTSRAPSNSPAFAQLAAA